MPTSEAIDQVTAALAKAQGEIANPTKGATNLHFRSTYADLSSGINAIREALTTNGIAFIQATRLEGEILFVDTRLAHASGQWVESEFPACRFPAKPQEVGSAITYARRYALFALVGIAGDDDDGNAASQTETPAQTRKPPKPPAAPVVTDADIEWSLTKRQALIKIMEMAQDPIELEKWGVEHKDEIRNLLPDDKDMVTAAYVDHKRAISGAI